MISRDEAFALVDERIPQRQPRQPLRRHRDHHGARSPSTSAAPRPTSSAGRSPGLLHDLDYAETADDPARHGLVTAELLAGLVDDEMMHAILAHADKVERETLMDHALWCADPTTGFIVAAALVRPEKDLDNVAAQEPQEALEGRRVREGRVREQMAGCELLGIERDEFLALALDGDAGAQERDRALARMLNVIVFVCGAALMALEIVAARVLAPALGNSIFVWGSVISIVMIALSLGYWVGGQLADKRDASRVLSPLIAAARRAHRAGAGRRRRRRCPRVAGLDPRLGSLVAAALIFFVPALLLATVSPLSVRLAASRGHGPHRPLRRRAVRDLDRRQHRGHARHGVLAHPAALARAARRRDRVHAVRVLRWRRCGCRGSTARPLRPTTDRARPAWPRLASRARWRSRSGSWLRAWRSARGCLPTWRPSRRSTTEGRARARTAPTASTTASPSPRPTASATCASTRATSPRST